VNSSSSSFGVVKEIVVGYLWKHSLIRAGCNLAGAQYGAAEHA